jgi:hypothetical protein
MLKRLLVATLALAFSIIPLQAAATDYTDIWYLPSESGWGVNMVQSDTFIFATFFVYGSGNQPTWYTAQMASDANGNFAGTLYSTVGTYLGAPWDPTKLVVTPAGTASFAPLNAYQGTLSYSIASGPTVTKSIQRQTLTTITLAGNYSGTQSGTYAGNSCSIAGGYTDNFTLTVTQPGDGTATFQFNYASNLMCAVSGTLVQQGRLYAIPNASYQCTGNMGGFNTTANVDELQATPHGIEAIFSAASEPGNCSESAIFAGVLF